MDYFSKDKYLKWAVIALIAINLVTLIALVVISIKPETQQIARHERNIGPAIQKELGLTDDQAKKFKEMRIDHHKKMSDFHDDMHSLKTKLTDEQLSENPNQQKTDSLIEYLGEIHILIEYEINDHVLKLSSILDDSQKEKFHEMMLKFNKIKEPGKGMCGPKRPGRHSGRKGGNHPAPR